LIFNKTASGSLKSLLSSFLKCFPEVLSHLYTEQSSRFQSLPAYQVVL